MDHMTRSDWAALGAFVALAAATAISFLVR